MHFSFRNFLACLLKNRAMKSKIQLIFVVEKSSCKTLIYPASSYVLGGTHMTNPALLVGRILKELTATEDTFYG